MHDRDLPAGGVPFPTVPTVIFAHWRELLNLTPLAPQSRSGYSLAIGGYLDYCRLNNLSVTPQSARAYMSDVGPRPPAGV